MIAFSGHTPIINANVTAAVERPDSKQITLGLQDNGAGRIDCIFSCLYKAVGTCCGWRGGSNLR